MERVTSKEECRQALSQARREHKTVALVPTMGALHDGHMSLVRAACKRADYTVVSIFVNPTQFGEGEDFGAYPRDIVHDLELLRAEGVDLLFTPTTDVMYGRDAQVTVDPGPLSKRWEGEVRPGHFGGVATVVAKLMNIVRPDVAYFGEKDFQQLRIVEQMSRDLDLCVNIVPCPIIRERDGVAMSSRNAYLSPEERIQATALCEALELAAAALAWGERSADAIVALMASEIAKRQLAELDYAALVDSVTLEPVRTVDMPVRAILAARVGTTRLIDNAALVPPTK